MYNRDMLLLYDQCMYEMLVRHFHSLGLLAQTTLPHSLIPLQRPRLEALRRLRVLLAKSAIPFVDQLSGRLALTRQLTVGSQTSTPIPAPMVSLSSFQPLIRYSMNSSTDKALLFLCFLLSSGSVRSRWRSVPTEGGTISTTLILESLSCVRRFIVQKWTHAVRDQRYPWA
jgi:hypothetical protein